jgi:hypothetical protein
VRRTGIIVLVFLIEVGNRMFLQTTSLWQRSSALLQEKIHRVIEVPGVCLKDVLSCGSICACY